MEDFSLFIKVCYRIVWSKEKIQKKSQKLGKTKSRRIIISSKCKVCNCKKSKFIKQQEAGGLLSSLEIMIPLIEISFVLEVSTIWYNI